MNENVQKSLVMGASIMVTIGIISIGLMIFGQGSSLVKASSKNIVDLTEELNGKRYIAYEDTVMSGSEVVNAINTYTKKQLKIEVKTSESADACTYTSSYTNNDVNDEDYINVLGTFESDLIVNENGVVNGIRLNQI